MKRRMNQFEAKVYSDLVKASIDGDFLFGFEADIILYIKPEPMRNYTPDFTIMRKDGHPIYVETKGYFRPEARTKMRNVKACNLELDIRIIFQRNQMINKKTGFDYLQWAERNGFPCAVGTIPKEWLK